MYHAHIWCMHCTYIYILIKEAFTQQLFPPKTNTFFAVYASHLHYNDKNAYNTVCVYTKWRLLFGDQSRDLKNEYRKTCFLCVNGKNEYFNEYGDLCQPIVTWLICHHVTSIRNRSHPHCSAQVSKGSSPSSFPTKSFFLLAATRLVGVSLNMHRLHACGTIVTWKSHGYV